MEKELTGAVFTAHALQQMERRGIRERDVRDILAHPETVIRVRAGRIVAQGKVVGPEIEGQALLRVFVDIDRRPPEIVTVYRTTRFAKYEVRR